MTDTARLEIEQAESQSLWPDIPFNDLLRHMDATVNVRVVSATTTAQPGAPTAGDLYILPSGQTGAQWGSFTTGALAHYDGSTWAQYTVPADVAILAHANDTGRVWYSTTANTWTAFSSLMGVRGADIASGATVNLATATGDYVHVTGNTGPITSLGSPTAANTGLVRVTVLDSTPTFTHNATTLICLTGSDVVAEANDVATWRWEGTGWRMVDYVRASGKPLSGLVVDTSGTPLANDFARFVDANTIEGRDYAEVRSDLSLEVGVDVQAWDATLDTVAAWALTGTADNTTFLTGAGTFANFINGPFGVGGAVGSVTGFRVQTPVTGGTAAYGFRNEGVVQSGVTSVATYNFTIAATVAAAFTVTDLIHNWATQGTFGAGSTVSSQTAFYADSSLTGATNNYGFRSNIAAGTGRWNFYASGTANNYFGGSVGIGDTSLTGITLVAGKNMTGGTTTYGIASTGTVQADVTGTAAMFRTTGRTMASAFTLTSLIHLWCSQSTIGAGSTVTNQYGVYVDSNLTGATNNYGVWSNIAAGTDRWNLYAAGTARNYAAGGWGLGSTTDVPSALLYMTSTTQGFRPPAMTTTQRDAISSPAAGLVIYNTSTNKLNVYTTAWEAVTSA